MKLETLLPNLQRKERLIAASIIIVGMVILIAFIYLGQLSVRSFRLELIWRIRWIFIVGILLAMDQAYGDFYTQVPTIPNLW